MARLDQGWVKIYRPLFDGDLADHGDLTVITFIRLIIWANWKPTRVFFNGKQTEVGRGQLVTGLRELSKDAEFDPYLNKVRRSLSYLENSQRIEQVISNQGRLITIINYETYQSNEDSAEDNAQPTQQTDHKRTTNGLQLKEEVPCTSSFKKERKKERKNTGEPAFRKSYPEDFESLWKQYGNKGNKKDAYEIFKSSELTLDEKAQLITAVKNYHMSQPEIKFRKDFERFLKSDWRIYLETGSTKLVEKNLDLL